MNTGGLGQLGQDGQQGPWLVWSLRFHHPSKQDLNIHSSPVAELSRSPSFHTTLWLDLPSFRLSCVGAEPGGCLEPREVAEGRKREPRPGGPDFLHTPPTVYITSEP